MSTFYANLALYATTFLFFYLRERKWGLKPIVFLFYSLFAGASIYAIDSQIYFETFGNFNLNNIDFAPLLLNYLLILLMSTSLNSVKKIKLDAISLDSQLITICEFLIIALCIIHLIFQYMWGQMTAGLELSDVYDAGHSGDTEITFPAQWMNMVYYRSKELISFATPLVYIVEFMNLALGKHIKKSLIIIALIFIPTIMGYGMSANRGGIVFAGASLCFFVIFFWRNFAPQLKRTLSLIGGGIAILAIGYLVAISFSRFNEDTEESTEQVFRYFGETYPNLVWQIWDEDGRPLEGMRMYPTVYKAMGGRIPVYNDEGFGGAQSMYGDVSGYPILLFKTFYGDLYVEFGPWIPFLIVFIYLLVVHWMQRKLRYSIFALIILHFSFMTLIWGLFDCYLIEANVLTLLLQFLVALYFNKQLSKSSSAKPTDDTAATMQIQSN